MHAETWSLDFSSPHHDQYTIPWLALATAILHDSHSAISSSQNMSSTACSKWVLLIGR